MNKKSENTTTLDNVNISRRLLTQAAWATPVIVSVITPAHAQTSALTCSITADQSSVVPGGTITGLQTTVSPPTEGVLVTCTPTTDDPDFPTLGFDISTTDESGVATFSNISVPDEIDFGTVITFTDSLADGDESGVTLEPCTLVITVLTPAA